KGRGRALRAIWGASRSPVVAYMDVDLSTGLDALLPLVAPLLSGHSDVAIGSRLAPGARVVRGARRETISRIYNGLLHLWLRIGFSDAQCGFKAMRTDVARALLPLVEDEAWFFDTELLVLAERNGLRIHEVPVDWVDDSDSRVDVKRTALDDLRGMWRMTRGLASSRLLAAPVAGRRAPADDAGAELVRFVAIGSGSTLAYFVLFLALRPDLGAIAANVVALLLCATGNRAAHRHAAGDEHPASMLASVARSGAGLAVSAGLTTVALLVAGWTARGALPAELALLLLATAGATMVRFLMLRGELTRAARG
ncbi:MAG: glycosyltransferase, partial [Actinobacteria bacterium]|nr:glycosyltransferase [Actinomycetota bacterium]